MKSYMAKVGEVNRNWVIIDLDGLVVGRVASQIAKILRGKTKPQFTPHTDTGDFVIAINASKLKLTGNKLSDKIYNHVTRYVGHAKAVPAGKMLTKKPEDILRIAVKGMLPRTNLCHQQLTKLKIFSGADHPHAAQNPTPYKVEA